MNFVEPIRDRKIPYLFMDSDETATQSDCIYPPNTTPGDGDYIEGTFDCDWDNDGNDDVFDAHHRG